MILNAFATACIAVAAVALGLRAWHGLSLGWQDEQPAQTWLSAFACLFLLIPLWAVWA